MSTYYAKCYIKHGGFPGGSAGKESACNAGDLGSIPGWEDTLERGMATHSSVHAWKMSWREDPGWLKSIGSQTVGHDPVTNTFTFKASMNMNEV